VLGIRVTNYNATNKHDYYHAIYSEKTAQVDAQIRREFKYEPDF